MALTSRANVTVMEGKHPQATGPPPQPPQVTSPQLTFTSAEVEKMVKKFRRGSAPGPSGLRPEHLRVCLQAAPWRRQRALQSLTSLVNCMTAGGVPSQVAPYLCGAHLHGALKKDGGIRPIAVGNLLRRLVGKCCATRVQEKAAHGTGRERGGPPPLGSPGNFAAAGKCCDSGKQDPQLPTTTS